MFPDDHRVVNVVSRIFAQASCAAGEEGLDYFLAPCPFPPSLDDCADQCARSENCTAFQLRGGGPFGDGNCIKWQASGCDGLGGIRGTGAHAGTLYRGMRNHRVWPMPLYAAAAAGRLPVSGAVPARGEEGAACEVKCDGAVIGAGRCRCTCFANYTGAHCGACNTEGGFYRLKGAALNEPACLRCENTEHCNGNAEEVSATEF
eukprot:gene4869-6302_t